MDPNAALHRLLTALRDHDDAPTREERAEARADALDALEALTDWVADGGFLPLPVRWTRGDA